MSELTEVIHGLEIQAESIATNLKTLCKLLEKIISDKGYLVTAQ